MTRYKFQNNDKVKKKTPAFGSERRTSCPPRPGDDDYIVSTTTKSSALGGMNGFHSSDEDEDFENSGVKTRNAHSSNSSLGKNLSSTSNMVDPTFGPTSNRKVPSQNYLKDANSVSSSTAIPLPAPSSSVAATVGGNSTIYESRNRMKSPTPSSPWSSPIAARLDPGVVGFHNIGNTCFMNSALQCLLHSGTLAEYFLKTSDLDTLGPTSASLVAAFHTLMSSVWSGGQSSMYLNEFRTILGNIHCQFKDGRQHDCQEFLALTLDTMHEQLKKWRTLNRLSPERSLETTPDRELNGEATTCDEKGRSATKVSLNSVVVNNNVFGSKLSAQSKETPPLDFNATKNRKKLGCKVKFPSSATNFPLPVEQVISSRLRSKDLKRCQPVIQGRRTINPRKNYGKESQIFKRAKLDSTEVKVENGNVKNDPYEFSDDSPMETEDKPIVTVVPEVVDAKPSSSSSVGSGTKRLEQTVVSQNGVPPKRRKQSLEEMSAKVEKFWNDHLATNDTVITSTFQGVHKSTVTCAECSYVSETYEPFMYLSLPIPRTMNRQLAVSFVSSKDRRSFKVNLNVKLSDTMTCLKEAVAKAAPIDQSFDLTDRIDNFVIAEVCNYQVSKVLENSVEVSSLDDAKSIYMYELNDNFDQNYPSNGVLQPFDSTAQINLNPTNPVTSTCATSAESYLTSTEEDWDTDAPPPLIIANGGSSPRGPSSSPSENHPSSTMEANNEVSSSTGPTLENGETTKCQDYLVCCICQEDFPSSVLQRHGCGSILCKGCAKRAAQYYEKSEENVQKLEGGTHFSCPLCRALVDVEKDYYDCVPSGGGASLLVTSVLCRFDPGSDTNNNSSSPIRVFGTPYVIKIPFTLSAEEFYDCIEGFNPFPDSEFKVLNVGRDGTQCGLCLYTTNCKGCEFPRKGEISVSRNSSIAINFTAISEEQILSVQPTNMVVSKPSFTFPTTNWTDNEPAIDIHASLRTFSESEILDEQNPWFCPSCKVNRCATKTITVCRFPDYLIVYLKRFVYAKSISNKLNNKIRFPVTDLDLNQYIAPECESTSSVYDLYSCVCHFGTVTSGHYIAYGKNPQTNRWHHFNDAVVTEKTPGPDDYSSAYVLFYKRKGIRYDIPKVKRPITFSTSPSKPIGHASPIPARMFYGDTSSTSTNSRLNATFREASPPAVRTMDANSTHELSLSATSTNGHPHSSSSSLRLHYPSSTVTAENDEEILSEEELPVMSIGNGSGDGINTTWHTASSSSSYSQSESGEGKVRRNLSRNRSRPPFHVGENQMKGKGDDEEED